MKLYELGPAPVVVRCPSIDEPRAKGFTVYESGWFYNRGLRPLRMRCLVDVGLAAAAAPRRRQSIAEFMRDEALAICLPQINAAREANRS